MLQKRSSIHGIPIDILGEGCSIGRFRWFSGFGGVPSGGGGVGGGGRSTGGARALAEERASGGRGVFEPPLGRRSEGGVRRMGAIVWGIHEFG